MTNEFLNTDAKWHFEAFREQDFSNKKTWFLRATHVDSGVQWVYFQSFTDSDGPRSLATFYQAHDEHQIAWTPNPCIWERRGLPRT